MKHLDQTTIDAIYREECRTLAGFLRWSWRTIEPGQPLVWGWHLDAICDHLEAMARGEITRLVINIPPGATKSTTSMVAFPAWLWGPFGKPGHRFIGAAHEQGLATRDNRITRRLIESPWYQRLWPTALMSDQNEKMYFENDKGGFRQAAAVTGMTGRRGDIVGWDDPLAATKAHSKAHRDDAIRVLTETLPTRLRNPETSGFFVVMQRLHEQDPTGYILANDLGYEHLCIPMEYEPTNRVTSIGWRDPRTEPGELLCPERFSRAEVDRLKKAMGTYATAGQLQQRPTPAGGGILKTEWFGFWRALTALSHRIIFADTAQKTGQENDYSVLQCWGYTAAGQAVLIDQIRGKWEAPELLTHARAFWIKHKADGAPLRALKIEDKSSGTGLVQTLRREGIPVLPIARGRDKVSRAHDVAPSIEAGHVMLPQDAPFLSDLLAEIEAFPNGAHDDQVDPLMDAVAELGATTRNPSIRRL